MQNQVFADYIQAKDKSDAFLWQRKVRLVNALADKSNPDIKEFLKKEEAELKKAVNAQQEAEEAVEAQMAAEEQLKVYEERLRELRERPPQPDSDDQAEEVEEVTKAAEQAQETLKEKSEQVDEKAKLLREHNLHLEQIPSYKRRYLNQSSRVPQVEIERPAGTVPPPP